jgi:hypothetical protein
MAKAKTVETAASVTDFVKSVPDPTRQKDALQIIKIMKEVSGFTPRPLLDLEATTTNMRADMKVTHHLLLSPQEKTSLPYTLHQLSKSGKNY